jgi:hypothetical protein
MGCVDPNQFGIYTLPVIMAVVSIFFMAFRIAMRPPVLTTVEPIERAGPPVLKVVH